MISSPIGFSLEDRGRDRGIKLGPRERDIEVPSPACGGGSGWGANQMRGLHPGNTPLPLTPPARGGETDSRACPSFG